MNTWQSIVAVDEVNATCIYGPVRTQRSGEWSPIRRRRLLFVYTSPDRLKPALWLLEARAGVHGYCVRVPGYIPDGRSVSGR